MADVASIHSVESYLNGTSWLWLKWIVHLHSDKHLVGDVHLRLHAVAVQQETRSGIGVFGEGACVRRTSAMPMPARIQMSKCPNVMSLRPIVDAAMGNLALRSSARGWDLCRSSRSSRFSQSRNCEPSSYKAGKGRQREIIDNVSCVFVFVFVFIFAARQETGDRRQETKVQSVLLSYMYLFVYHYLLFTMAMATHLVPIYLLAERAGWSSLLPCRNCKSRNGSPHCHHFISKALH
jgi:hypothetical protein